MATTIIGILLIVMAVFLVISVLMQSSKDHRLGSSIAGGAETFFGKAKGKSMDAMFNKLTTIVAIVFVILVIILYVIQPEPCAWCGSPEHEAATIEECPTYLAVQEEANASGANLEEQVPESSSANLDAEPEATPEVEAEVEAAPEVTPEVEPEAEPEVAPEAEPVVAE